MPAANEPELELPDESLAWVPLIATPAELEAELLDEGINLKNCSNKYKYHLFKRSHKYFFKYIILNFIIIPGTSPRIYTFFKLEK